MTEMISPAVVWAIIGVVLIVIEMATMTFFLIFFGVSAILVAIAKAFGLSNFVIEILMFSLLGVAGMFVFRKKLEQVFAPRDGELKTDVAQMIVLSDGIAPQSEAIIEYQGSKWTAYNDSASRLSKGDRVMIVRTEGVKLIVRPN